jgi:hypothetical protein
MSLLPVALVTKHNEVAQPILNSPEIRKRDTMKWEFIMRLQIGGDAAEGTELMGFMKLCSRCLPVLRTLL